MTLFSLKTQDITVEEPYRAMNFYLEKLQAMTNPDDLAGFLGGMSFLSHLKPRMQQSGVIGLKQLIKHNDDIQFKLT
jgi:hypothetical protein